jgi:hypothetical protein
MFSKLLDNSKLSFQSILNPFFKKKYFKWQLFIFVSIVIHFAYFNVHPLQFDELLMYEKSKRPLGHLLYSIINTDIQMPLGYLISKLILTFFGENTFALRVYSLILIIALPFSFFNLSKKFLSELNSYKALLLLILFHPIIIYSSSMRPYILLILLTIELTSNYLEQLNDYKQRKAYSFMAFGLLLTLTHPLGILLFLTYSFSLLYKNRQYKSIYALALFLGLIFVLFFFLKKDLFVFAFNTHINTSSLISYLLSLSYLTSGLYFSILILILTLIMLFRMFSKNEKLFLKAPQNFAVLFVFFTIIIGLILSLITKNLLYPRHLFFCLPFLAILIIQILHFSIPNIAINNFFYSLLIVSLLGKSYYREKMFTLPFEIDSKKIASRAQELSKNNLHIYSCGNCFHFYIKNSNYTCIDSVNEFLKKSKFPPVFIFIDLNYSKDLCHPEIFENSFKTLHYEVYKGGSVYKFKQN